MRLLTKLLAILLLPSIAYATSPGVSPSTGGISPAGNMTYSGGPAPPLTNPAGGANNYAPINSPIFTTSVTLPAAVSCTGGNVLGGFAANFAPNCIPLPVFNGAPLVNPAGGQNNYAPIASPIHTGLVTISTLNLTNSTDTALLFGSPTTPNASIVSVGTNNMNIAAGAHYTNASGWIADATSASFINGGNGAISVYGKTGLTVGSAFSPVQIVGIDASGFNLLSGSARAPAFIGNGTPSFTGGTAAGSNQPTSTTGEITATGSSITITTGSNCGTRNVVGMILDASASTMAQLTARSATAITFTSVSGHVYDYAALSCG